MKRRLPLKRKQLHFDNLSYFEFGEKKSSLFTQQRVKSIYPARNNVIAVLKYAERYLII